jgi:hypothetical protein
LLPRQIYKQTRSTASERGASPFSCNKEIFRCLMQGKAKFNFWYNHAVCANSYTGTGK